MPIGSRGFRERVAAMVASGPIRSIAVLVGGTSTAHAITALVMPILTRLYTPESFTVAAAFSSILAIVAAVSCLRFDMAIPLPEDTVEAVNLLGLSTLSALGAAALTAVVLLALPEGAFAALDQPQLVAHLWLMPFAVLIAGLYLALQMWYVRVKAFGVVARSRIAQSGLAAGGQIGVGLNGGGAIGLIIGQIINYGAASITLGLRFLLRERPLWRQISRAGMASAFRVYHRFPRYSVWEALANAASINLPILIIVASASGPEAGYLALAIFVLQAPMAVIGNAAGQVFVSGAAEAKREGKLDEYTLTSLAALLKTITPPLVAIAIVAPAAFGFVFGSGWERSGALATWMVPWFLMQFLASPISTALHVLGRQRTAMALQVAGLALRVGAVMLAGLIWPSWLSESYALSGFVFYFAYLVVVMRAVGLSAARLVPGLRGSLPLILIAAGVGCASGWLLAQISPI